MTINPEELFLLKKFTLLLSTQWLFLPLAVDILKVLDGGSWPWAFACLRA